MSRHAAPVQSLTKRGWAALTAPIPERSYREVIRDSLAAYMGTVGLILIPLALAMVPR
jgi:hypothetical protein